MYDQSSLYDFRTKYQEELVIHDRVDSSQILDEEIDMFEASIWSLSKTIGYKDGGIIYSNKKGFLEYEEFIPRLNLFGWNCLEDLNEHEDLLDYLDKAYGSQPSLDLIGMVKSKLLDKYLEYESLRRLENAELLLKYFPNEMLFHRLSIGSRPSVFPLCLYSQKEERTKVLNQCSELGVEVRSYNFNISPNPLEPKYIPCIALPIHSQVTLELIRQLGECTEHHLN